MTYSWILFVISLGLINRGRFWLTNELGGYGDFTKSLAAILLVSSSMLFLDIPFFMSWGLGLTYLFFIELKNSPFFNPLRSRALKSGMKLPWLKLYMMTMRGYSGIIMFIPIALVAHSWFPVFCGIMFAPMWATIYTFVTNRSLAEWLAGLTTGAFIVLSLTQL